MSRPASTATVDVDSILRDRIMASADRIIKMMPPAAKAAAIGSVDVAALVFNIARGIPSVETDDPDKAEDITRAIAFKRRLIDEAGGAFDAEAVRNCRRSDPAFAISTEPMRWRSAYARPPDAISSSCARAIRFNRSV